MYGSGEDEGDAIQLAAGEIYTLDAFTAQPWRGRGIHLALLTHMLRTARELGYTDAFTMASVLKRRSHRNLRRLGWTETGRAVRIRRAGGRFRILWLRGSRRPLA
jgi:GNAT superfamily N-acetyltransferase